MAIKDLSSLNKPREKAILYGISSLSDAELLAILIQAGTVKDDALVLANRVLCLAHGVDGLSKLTALDLCKINGIKKAKALKLLSAIELGKRANVSPTLMFQVKDSKNIYEKFGILIKNNLVENIILLCLDSHQRVLHYEIFTDEKENASSINSKVLLKKAVQYGSTYTVLLHNHPSGVNKPSEEDIANTQLIALEFESVGIRLIDHIIVTSSGYYSFKDDFDNFQK